MKRLKEASSFVKKLNILYIFIFYSLLACSVGVTDQKNELAEEVKKIVPKVYMVGDCGDARALLDATNEGVCRPKDLNNDLSLDCEFRMEEFLLTINESTNGDGGAYGLRNPDL